MDPQIAGGIVGALAAGTIGGVGWLVKSLVSKNGKSGWEHCPDQGKIEPIAIDVGQTRTIVEEIRQDVKEIFPRVGKLEQSVAVLNDRVKKNDRNV